MEDFLKFEKATKNPQKLSILNKDSLSIIHLNVGQSKINFKTIIFIIDIFKPQSTCSWFTCFFITLLLGRGKEVSND